MAKACSVLGIHLRLRDLRRHAATYAFRSGAPIEIVSKVILRHANLSTTQRYLGKVSDVEAMKRIDNPYGQMECSQGDAARVFTLTIPWDVPSEPVDIIH